MEQRAWTYTGRVIERFRSGLSEGWEVQGGETLSEAAGTVCAKSCVCQERIEPSQETERKNIWLELENKEGIIGSKVEKGTQVYGMDLFVSINSCNSDIGDNIYIELISYN